MRRAWRKEQNAKRRTDFKPNGDWELQEELNEANWQTLRNLLLDEACFLLLNHH